MRTIIITICMMVLSVGVAFAGGNSSSCDGYKGKLLNRCVGHPSQGDEAGLGVDVLIHKLDQGDLVAEYKYDFNNENHSIYGVFKTNKSLVEIVKGFLNKDSGE